MTKLNAMIRQFRELDFSYRLELLLDFADNLPELPDKYRTAREAGQNRVAECQTPVFLWAEVENQKVRLYADASPESPTVRGYVSFLVDTLSGMSPEEIEKAPNNLLDQLALSHYMGISRIQGLTALVPRIKEEVRKALQK